MKKIIAAGLLCFLIVLILSTAASASVKRLLTVEDLYKMGDDESITIAELLPILDALREDAYQQGYRDALELGSTSTTDYNIATRALLGTVDYYVLNTHTHKFHYPTCNAVYKIAPENYKEYEGSPDEIISMGYDPCGICRPYA